MKILNELYDVVVERKNSKIEGSYTCYLFDKGLDKILKKCGEESAEVIIAAKNNDNNELKNEIADLLYHLTVLCAQQGLRWEEIEMVLKERKCLKK
ncbi:MAG: phosphoribosyl-ATP diphosphatase [Oscillospiraceae bacterium]|nr:phosphoribosyl-ATP diphosphatase [Oscillospiraceae bacterium]